MQTILIVDDEYGLAEMAAELLTLAGYTATMAINGQLAFASLEQARPDLILLDVMMPIMSGDEMLRALKSDPVYREIPVVMMSALGREAVPEDLQPLIAGVLQKPFTYDEMLAALRAGLPPEATAVRPD